MATNIGEQQAFPRGGIQSGDGLFAGAHGMTYRQWLVGMAMQGLLASDTKMEVNYETIAMQAVKHTDAVLAELAKE